ncbi:unnamed protein product [Protopolystoma xenopodis]|uniref:Uncharacterized protein n=1 Tax=Protopolystoma xenopodis TaxID=117903 RepID=A0A3S5BXT6_9PLAT|nr:unnamed protein product [Protopolystoma xenopodis]
MRLCRQPLGGCVLSGHRRVALVLPLNWLDGLDTRTGRVTGSSPNSCFTSEQTSNLTNSHSFQSDPFSGRYLPLNVSPAWQYARRNRPVAHARTFSDGFSYGLDLPLPQQQ